MKQDDPNLDILQNLESAVIQVFRAYPEMTDYVALRAYEAAFQYYRSELRGGVPKPHNLTGIDTKTFDAVQEVCEFRLGRRPLSDRPDATISPASVETIVDCLRKLMRSVEFNTKQGGRQGYLTFVSQFVH